ncbi:MAG: hypothetical protein KDM64_02815 [Verrucomicrobiae bacterium]|nr:hypothetical protein [Verrucomicrobiae bacterium]
MIFIQIAAYRDPELVPTIRDCLAKAAYPNDLRFGICWQTEENDRCLDPFLDSPQFRIQRVPWHESKGLCWARSEIQKLYGGEELTLQLDSHHRFAPGWDKFLLESLEACGSAKPILTTYAGVYEPGKSETPPSGPFKMVADRFTPSGTILFRPHHIRDWEALSAPIPARFVSGHFFFTLGKHCEEYLYDPQLYFAGDEISLSIRSYTLGYDLFHPHRNVVWHEYTRAGRVKHWDDHTAKQADAAIEMPWHERDVVSKRRLRKMLREEDNDEAIGIYGLGTVRSHGDYERYAGIDFGRRLLQRETVEGKDPPCTYTNTVQWEAGFTHEHRVPLMWRAEDIGLCDDLQFVYFGIEDANGTVLHRHDAPPESPEATGVIETKTITVVAQSKPAKLVLWPVSRSRGWLRRTDYPL